MKSLYLTLIVIVIIGFAGYILWQRGFFQANQQISTSQTSDNGNLESNHSLESTTQNSSSFIEDLRRRQYQGGEIKIEETLSKEGNYTSYVFSYPSDNLKIYGMMNVPDGNGPFPVIVLNHGYFNTQSFNSGDGSHAMADIL